MRQLVKKKCERTMKPGKLDMKLMEISEPSPTSHATASEAAALPVSGIQGTGEKWATGQSSKIIPPKTEICIAAWNVRTGHHVGQKEIIAKELKNYKISIAAVSELRLTGSGIMSIQPPSESYAMTLYYSGGEKQGVALGLRWIAE